jgi:undecaprenyl-diphosphatase
MERLEAYDLGMLYWFTKWRSPWLNESVMALTHLGDFLVVVCVMLIGAGTLILLRRTRLACILILVALLGWSIEWTLKPAVGRPRPHLQNALAEVPAQPGFPSGHALGTMAVYGSLGLLLGRVFPRGRVPFLVVGVLLSLVVGLTRVMIGVHYPFDVLAGWVGGLLCVAVAHALADPPQAKAPGEGREGDVECPPPSLPSD